MSSFTGVQFRGRRRVLFREDARGLILVTQPAHAFVSGQLARAWGNPAFGSVAPLADVALAADQHDIGWATWEATPTLNPRTGRPHRFFELSVEQHLGLWSGAAARVLPQSRYAALLVSGHITGLYARRDHADDAPTDARRIAEFLAVEARFQNDLLASLGADPVYAPYVTHDAVARNQRLLAVWDRLSLALCGGLREPLTVEAVPGDDGARSIQVFPRAGAVDEATLDPWPFGAEQVDLVFEGRRLPFTFLDETQMRGVLKSAPWVTTRLILRPAEGSGL